jgi:hypothetical protein
VPWLKPLIFFTSSLATKESASKSPQWAGAQPKSASYARTYGLSHAHYTYLFQTAIDMASTSTMMYPVISSAQRLEMRTSDSTSTVNILRSTTKQICILTGGTSYRLSCDEGDKASWRWETSDRDQWYRVAYLRVCPAVIRFCESYIAW